MFKQLYKVFSSNILLNRWLKVMARISLKKKAWFSLIALILLALLTTMFLETSLRVAALFVGPRLVIPASGGKKNVILCLGDSNTYGVSCSEDEAYPGQLQRIFERQRTRSLPCAQFGLARNDSISDCSSSC